MSRVTPDRQAKSIGQEETFGTNLADPAELRKILFAQAEQVGRRLRKAGLRAKSVWVKIRFGDFKTITRQATLGDPTDLTTFKCKGSAIAWLSLSSCSPAPALASMSVRTVSMSSSPRQIETGARPSQAILIRLA